MPVFKWKLICNCWYWHLVWNVWLKNWKLKLYYEARKKCLYWWIKIKVCIQMVHSKCKCTSSGCFASLLMWLIDTLLIEEYRSDQFKTMKLKLAATLTQPIQTWIIIITSACVNGDSGWAIGLYCLALALVSRLKLIRF